MKTGKLFTICAMKGYGGRTGIVHSVLTYALGGSEWLTSCPAWKEP